MGAGKSIDGMVKGLQCATGGGSSVHGRRRAAGAPVAAPLTPSLNFQHGVQVGHGPTTHRARGGLRHGQRARWVLSHVPPRAYTGTAMLAYIQIYIPTQLGDANLCAKVRGE